MPVPDPRPGKPGYRVEVSWTWRSAVQRSAATLRERGLRTFLAKALGETVYRRLLVLERDLSIPPLPATAGIPATFQRLTDDEAADYAEFRADTPLAEVRERLARGMECFTARHQGRIVCATWATRGAGRDAYLQRAFRLDTADVYLSDTFTEPALRGRGLGPALGAAIIQHYRDQGCRRIIVTVLPENTASLKARARNGFTARVTLRTIRLGPWRWHLGSIPPHRNNP
jgi:GNAT superfamily N-acetyltransferase